MLRTTWRSRGAEAEVIDFMPFRDGRSNLVRRVRGVSGTMRFRGTLRLRFDYGILRPWVRHVDEPEGPAVLAVAGPDAIILRGAPHHPVDGAHVTEFEVGPDEIVDIGLTRYPSHLTPPARIDVADILEWTIDWWQDWAARSKPPSPYDREVQRSLLVLQGLTHDETGGVVAAATTSLPEELGGIRNWDYRYVWLRDAALTIEVLLDHGYREKPRSGAGGCSVRSPGIRPGSRSCTTWRGAPPARDRGRPLPGYAGSAPVRIGNAAYTQVQWDVYGEVMVALHAARLAGVHEDEFSWPLQTALLDFLATNWRRPDRGIWEIRGPDRQFTHSKAMIWAAFDRGIRGVEEFDLPGPVGAGAGSATRCATTSCATATTPSAARSRSTTAAGHGCRAAPASADRLHRRRRPAHARHGRRHRARAAPRRPAPPLPHRDGCRRPARQREPVPRLLVLARRAVRGVRTASRTRRP